MFTQRATRFWLGAILLLGCLKVEPLHAQPSDAQVFSELKRDERFIHDLNELDFGTDSPGAAWVVARTSSRPSEGYFSEGRMMRVTQGKFHVLQTLSGPPQQDQDYKWEEPERGRFSGPSSTVNAELLALQNGFSVSSTILVRLNEGELGKDKFGPTFVIPDEWAKFAAPAFDFWKTNRALLQVGLVGANRARLLTLTEDANPLIGERAASVLAQASLLDVNFVRAPLARAKGLRQAAFVSFVLSQFPFKDPLAPGNASVAGALNSVVDRANDASVLKPFG